MRPMSLDVDFNSIVTDAFVIAQTTGGLFVEGGEVQFVIVGDYEVTFGHVNEESCVTHIRRLIKNTDTSWLDPYQRRHSR